MKRPWVNHKGGRQLPADQSRSDIDTALEMNAKAREKRAEVEHTRGQIDADRKRNGYAEMIKRALGGVR
jgi:hypothetical protein